MTPLGEELKPPNFDKFEFPRNTQNRSFQSQWINQFKWIEYSKVADAIFCYACRQFAVHPTRDSFVTTGFRSWSAALADKKGLKKHESSSSHIAAMSAWVEKKSRLTSGKSITTLLSHNVLERRRYYFGGIIETVMFLAKNELAFRGDWDAEQREESSLFNSLFQFMMRRDPLMIEAEKSLPPHLTYRSPSIQNEVISITAQLMRQELVAEINKANYFTLMADGTKDRNGEEFLSIACRYVCDDLLKESLIKFVKIDQLDAAFIANTILKTIDEVGLSRDKIISQCYDGASVMSGTQGGVQRIIERELRRKIPFVHCFNHRLHLVVVNSIQKVDLVREYFETSNLICTFFHRFKIKKIYEGTNIVRLIDTRWSCHLRAATTVLENYTEITDTLNSLDGIKLSAEDRAFGVGLRDAIRKPQFIFILIVVKNVLQLIAPADKFLQDRQKGYVDGKPIIDSTIDLLKKKRSQDQYTEYFNEYVKMKAEFGIEEPPQRRRRLPQRLDHSVVMETTGARGDDGDLEIKLKSTYFELVDIIIASLEKRFTENDEILLCLSLKFEDISLDKIAPMSQIIPLPDKSELEIACSFLPKKNVKHGEELKALNPVKEAFPAVFNYICGVHTFGCSTAMCESSFSAMKRVQTVQRLSMTEDRLMNLSYIAFESKRCDGSDVEFRNQIMREFHKKKDRKVHLF